MNHKKYGSILVVDDDPFVLNSTSLLLNKYGYHVTSAETAQDGLNRFQELKTDAVLTDIKMPGMSGIELLEKIHALDTETPVVLMTAYAELDIAIDAIKKGAFDFIIKPYKPIQLEHSIGRAVNYKRLCQIEKDYKHILEEFNQELEALVAERTMSLMALTLADKVRNPASVIGSICRRILEKETISEKLKDSLTIISDEADKLQGIVKDFQTLLKSKRSLFNYEDLNVIAGNVLSVLENEAAHKGLKLTVRLSQEPLKMNTQKDLLRVAIFHVLRNAIEATPEGGKITVETFEGNNDNLVLSVSDTGHGIPREDISRIFEPFYSTKTQRFGMGLPLIKQIVSEHMGEIAVESEPGKGTTFRMMFPVRWAEKG